MNEIKDYNYLNNISDIIVISKDNKFQKLLKKIDDTQIIVTSHLVHKNKIISSKEQFFFNLDNYITLLKNHLFINPFEIRIIVSLTIYNRYNKILFSKDYYYSNIDKYEKNYIKMFMYNYEKNIKFLKNYCKIELRNFYQLIDKINQHKKKSYSYFENINTSNMNFYLPIIKYLEGIN